MCTGPRPFIPVAGVVRVQMVYLWQGQRVENVFNVKSGAGLAVADLDRIQALMATWHNTSLKPQQHFQCTLNLWILDALDSAAGLHKEYPVSVAGTFGGSIVPNNSTVAVKWSTGLRGRSFRGRTFHVGLGLSHLQDGVRLGSGNVTAIQAAYNALLTAFNAAGTPDRLAVVSYCSGGAWRAAGVATNISAATLDASLDSQRRRLAGRGL